MKNVYDWRMAGEIPWDNVSDMPDIRDPKEWEPCHCGCHKNPGIKHVRACCDNGWVRRHQLPAAWHGPQS